MTWLLKRASVRGWVQDIAVVPFLVLLPLVENSDMTSTGAMDLLSQLGPTALQTVGSLGLLLLTGRTVLRRVFKVHLPAVSPVNGHIAVMVIFQRCLHNC